MVQPQPGQPIAGPPYYRTFVSWRFWFVLFAIVCFVIGLVVGTGWVTESAKADDVLVFMSLGLAFFAAAHLPFV